ncbi:MAG: alpha-glucosidase/alpha-galactosidase [Armatimonadota bacterium]|nr:alpha-glucosidase/alpha-galactosidase [Armatimonadota bacterium]
MPKIVIIGAGSGFGGRLSIDILSRKPLQDSEICLCDIHPERLEKVRAYVQRTIDKYQLPAKVRASTNRRELLPNADFVVTSISVGGGAYYGFPYTAEIEIPRKYGVCQSVGDTVSPGAVFRFLRTGPVQHQMFADMEELCPRAFVLNHTNPMAMLSWLHSTGSSMRYVGLCHGIQGTTRNLARWIGVPYEEVSYTVAGINHLAWILEFKRGEEDLYPRVRALAENPEIADKERVRFEILKQFGYFCTESNHHDSEYLPYFRRTPELMAHYNLQPRRPADTPPRAREWMADTGVADDELPVGTLRLSHEYSSGIMEGIVTDTPYRFYGNVMNHHALITNLPGNCCVEVMCVADQRGIHPTYFGDLPPQLAALCRSNVAVQELAVKAVQERNREAAFHALCLDPLTAAVVPLPKIREMFEEMWEAEKELLKWFDPTHQGPLPETCAA